MLQQKLLKKIIQTSEDSGIEYMIAGSVASSLHGEPRSTHDIDVVVTIQKTDVPKLTNIFNSPRFYLDKESVLEAIEKKGMFNIIDAQEGGKIDFWMLKDDPFDHSRFSRRQKEKVMGFHMQVSSPEDTILAKLSGGSEKQFTDALRVYEVQSKNLDMDYLETWVKKLDVESLWNDLKAKAQM